MNLEETPWAGYRTMEPESLNCQRNKGEFLKLWVGHRLAAHLELKTNRLFQQGQQISAHRLILSPWQKAGTPVLRLHPFALLHLRATRQAPREDLYVVEKALKGSETGYLKWIDNPKSELCTMLEVRVLMLIFRSDYNCELRQLD